ncbi:MAP3K12-binding inhibitory protein 1-like [Saccostrea echinata]|uniref:MAP3K12-binding inhibitory protein 1-like n=1 Tax=Saccostrea echinata TaxID=191078 RepID=UPI002A7EEFF6|nr:MAP3K12-binding inhibitory protein 1-like [Saccostrea echinata]
MELQEEDMNRLMKLFTEFLKVLYNDFNLLDVLPRDSLEHNVDVCTEEFINSLKRLVTDLKDIQKKLQENQDKLNNDKSTDDSVELGDTNVEMEMIECKGDSLQHKTQDTYQTQSSVQACEKDNIANSNIQIKASSQEIERRIAAFIEQKRQEVDELNIREFCSTVSPVSETDSSCARVDSVFDTRIGGKSHIKVTRVVNLQGPQTQVSQPNHLTVVKKEPVEDPSFSAGIEERLQNIETHLKLDKREQRTDLFTRVKKMEERILYLESLSPEYFSSGIPLPMSSKRRRASARQPVNFQDVNNMTVSDIDDRIHMLRESLRRKAMNRV